MSTNSHSVSSLVRSTIQFTGPISLDTFVLYTDPEFPDWLKDVEDHEIVSIEFSNASIVLSATAARAWLENADIRPMEKSG